MKLFSTRTLCTAALAALMLAPAAVKAAEKTAAHEGWTREGSDIQPDKAVTMGVLANGVHYAVMPNAEPPGRISLRLYVRTGSFMESEKQRGLAHFLEHMAFNGTKHFAADQLVERFQRQGMSFGGDINAHTGQFETVYILELPKTDAELVGNCLQLLRDYVDGQNLSAEEIDKERGIILSEKRDRDSAQFRTMLAELDFLFPQSLLASRMPIGVEEVISKAPREEFLKLYHAGHVPARVAVIATGSVDPKTMVPMIEKYFGDMTTPEGAKPDPDLSWKAASGPHAGTHYEVEAPAVSVSLTTVQPVAKTPDTLARRRAELYRAIAHAIVTRRLQILAKQDGCPFQAKGVETEELFRTALLGDATVECRPEQWEASLKILEQEVRRAVSYGFTKAEIAEVTAQIAAMAEQETKAASTRKSRELADAIGKTYLEESVFTSPQADFEEVKADLAALTPEALLAEFRKVWGTADIGVFVAGNVKIEGGADKILAVYNASRTTEVKPPVAEKTAEFAYTSFGTPGTVVSRREIKDLGITQFTLTNNVRVNVKQTDFEANTVHVEVRIGGGLLCASPDKQGLALLAQAVFTAGGLGKHSADELERIFAGRHVGAGFKADSGAFIIAGDTTPKDFAAQLGYIAACITDPGYRPEAERQARKAFDVIYPQMRHDDIATLKNEVWRYLAGGDFRFGVLPPEKELAKRTTQEVREWLAGPLAKGYMEITIVGDIKADDALPEILKTFGALPVREKRLPAYKKERTVNYPAPTGGIVEFPYDSSIPKALAVTAWKTGVNRYEDPAAARRLSVLADILDDRLRVEIREKLGETYSPFARANCSDTYRKYGFIFGGAGAKPEQARTIVGLIAKIGGDLADKGATQDELDRALKPLINETRDAQHSNQYWLGVVSGSQQNPAQLERARTMQADLAAITLREINKLAAKVLRAKDAQPLLILPAAKKTAATPAAEAPKPVAK